MPGSLGVSDQRRRSHPVNRNPRVGIGQWLGWLVSVGGDAIGAVISGDADLVQIGRADTESLLGEGDLSSRPSDSAPDEIRATAAKASPAPLRSRGLVIATQAFVV